MYYYRGLSYKDSGNNTRAIQDLTKCIELNPNYAEAYYNRAISYQATGDDTRAQADYAKARALGYNG